MKVVTNNDLHFQIEKLNWVIQSFIYAYAKKIYVHVPSTTDLSIPGKGIVNSEENEEEWAGLEMD